MTGDRCCSRVQMTLLGRFLWTSQCSSKQFVGRVLCRSSLLIFLLIQPHRTTGQDDVSGGPWASPTTWADFSPDVSQTVSPQQLLGSATPVLAGGTCGPDTCQPPQCRCVGTDVPGDLPVADVPQMVMLTFDDAINGDNYGYFQELFPADDDDALRNPSGCRTAATFFVADPHGSNMTMISRLARRGNEIASHSQSHSEPATWSAEDWDTEIHGMRQTLAIDTGLFLDQIAGMRAPFLQLGGEAQFRMLQDRAFLYDSTMFGGSLKDNTSPPPWPFTLHFPPAPSQAMCDQERCPTGSYPRLWEVPLTQQYSTRGRTCTMTDGGCLESDASETDVTNFLRHNFHRHYWNNRAPFMISLHSTWFEDVANSYRGLRKFLRELNRIPDVWQVTLTQMLDWVRHPVPLSRVHEIPSWRC